MQGKLEMKRILIVDNEECMVAVVNEIILDMATHFEITQHTDWTTAVDDIEGCDPHNPYDLVITDFRMPRGREGLAVIKAAREKSTHTKVIVMSGDMTETDRKDAAANEYLMKPFDANQTKAMVRKLLPDLEAKPITPFYV